MTVSVEVSAPSMREALDRAREQVPHTFDLLRFDVEGFDELPPGAIHVDVCPGCEQAHTWHGLDAPHHCQCGYDREQAIPAIFVPLLVDGHTISEEV